MVVKKVAVKDQTTETEVEEESIELESDEEVEIDDELSEEVEEEEVEDSTNEDAEEDDDSEEDEVVVTIGEEAPPPEETEQAPEWVRELRKNHRETTRENRELKEKLKKLEEGDVKPQPLGKKPVLSDYDYDTEAFEKALTDWYEKKRLTDEEARKLEADQKAQEDAWKNQLDTYTQQRAKLKVRDFDDAETEAFDHLNVTQQGIIIQGAENPALVIYALGKNPKKAQELASITDPVKYAFAVANLEAKLKVTSRKAPPPPEKKVAVGTGSKGGVVDSQLERLRAEAEKTGDYTKVSQYKKQKRQAKT